MSYVENAESEVSVETFTHTDPLYDTEQTNRYERMKVTNQQLQKLTKVIENYITVGKKYSTAILELHDCIKDVDVVTFNSVFTNLNDTLLTLNSFINSHINQVESNMHIPTESFIKHDMNSVKQAKKEYVSIYSKYTEMNDKIITNQKKGSASIPADKIEKIKDLHRQSSHSFYEYVLQLDVAESRYNNLIGNIIIAYIKSWLKDDGLPFTETFKDKNSEIEEVQQHILKSNEEIAEKMLQSSKKHTSVDNTIDSFYRNIDMPFVGTPESEIQGYLWKRSGHFTVQWEKLFFMCRDGFLAASATPEQCARPLWTLQLLFCDIKVLDNEDRPNCFSIVSKDKTFIMQAPSLHMRDKWVATIRAQKEERFHSSTTPSSAEKKELDPNQVCADCGSPNIDWLIVNRGAILCEQCAGIHRSMPSSISRIKSLTMDTNDIFTLELRKKLGNVALNEILEATNVTGKINQCSPREDRRSFITKKYIDKAFISKEDVDLVAALNDRNLKGILYCILNGSITQTLPDGLTALHAAAIIGDPLSVALIALNCPSMLNTLDKGGWTPLNYAAYFNHIYCIDALLLYGADPRADSAVQPYAIAASRRFDEAATRLSEYRPESFEVVSGDPPSSAFKPAEGLDLAVFDENEKQRKFKEKSTIYNQQRREHRKDARSFSYSRRSARRNTLNPKSAPFQI